MRPFDPTPSTIFFLAATEVRIWFSPKAFAATAKAFCHGFQSMRLRNPSTGTTGNFLRLALEELEELEEAMLYRD
jgi:hypothetical protein